MPVRSLFVICFAHLLSFSGLLLCQTTRNYVVTAQQGGAIQFRDPATLEVVSRIDVNIPLNSTGIQGVFAEPGGQTLYFEGPLHSAPNDPSGCCWLYSIDLSSLQVKVAADIWGSKSRQRFVNAGPSFLTTVSDVALSVTQAKEDRWQVSPDGRWWAALRSGPSVDLYDATQNKIVKSLTAERGNAEWYLNGAWIKNQFYVYTSHDGSGWLWRLSPNSDRLEEPAAVSGPVSIPGCESGMALTEMSAVGDRLVVNEVFGGAIDRRQRCDGIPGGAWIIDPAFEQSVVTLTPDLYFWRLIPSGDGLGLYGVTSDAPAAGATSQLISLDARSGKVLSTQPLEVDYWWVIAAQLRSVPVGSRSVLLPIDNPY